MVIDLESKIRKLEINPFNTNEFVVVFRGYLIRFNTATMDYNNVYFDDKKMLDFNFSKEHKEEFLLSGDIKGQDNHHFAGYLNINKFLS